MQTSSFQGADVGYVYPRKLNSDITHPLYFADGNQLRLPTKQWLEGAGVLGPRWGAGTSHCGAPSSPAASAAAPLLTLPRPCSCLAPFGCRGGWWQGPGAPPWAPEAGGMSPRRNVPGQAGGISKAWRKPSASPGISGTSSMHGIAAAQQRAGRIQPQAHSLAFLGLPAQEANAGDRWARVSRGPRGNPKAGHGRGRQHSVAQVPPSKCAFPSLSPGKMLPRANPAMG